MFAWAYRRERGRWHWWRSIPGGPLDGLTADQALIIRFGRELLQAPRVSGETFQTVRARYGEKGLLELTALRGVSMMNATILRAMEHRPGPEAASAAQIGRIKKSAPVQQDGASKKLRQHQPTACLPWASFAAIKSHGVLALPRARGPLSGGLGA
jgi:hypothetical protein